MNSELNKRQISIFILIAFIFGGLAGAIIAPFSVQLLNSNATFNQIVKERIVGSEEELAVTSVVDRVNPAVVNIGIYKDGSSLNTIPPWFDNFFILPFESPKKNNQPKSEKKDDLQKVGGGSGFIIESNGLIVTNRHVVDDESATYKVVLFDQKEYGAKVLAKDQILDVALIKIEAENLPVLKLGDSDKLRLGETVIAIGNALSEYGNTVTKGVISGVKRRVEAGSNFSGFTEVIDEAIQTDAAINPGNSGGPLLNLLGEVIGINTAVSSEGQLVGFAIPINSLKKTIESVQKTGKIIRPWLGVRYVPVTPRLAELNNLSVKYGALIQRGESGEELAVIPGSPADKAGLVENDIILSINDEKLENKDSLSKEIGRLNVGDEAVLKIMHKGVEKQVRVKLEEFPLEIKN